MFNLQITGRKGGECIVFAHVHVLRIKDRDGLALTCPSDPREEKGQSDSLILSADLHGKQVLMMSEGRLGKGGRLPALLVYSQSQKFS